MSAIAAERGVDRTDVGDGVTLDQHPPVAAQPAAQRRPRSIASIDSGSGSPTTGTAEITATDVSLLAEHEVVPVVGREAVGRVVLAALRPAGSRRRTTRFSRKWVCTSITGAVPAPSLDERTVASAVSVPRSPGRRSGRPVRSRDRRARSRARGLQGQEPGRHAGCGQEEVAPRSSRGAARGRRRPREPAASPRCRRSSSGVGRYSPFEHGHSLSGRPGSSSVTPMRSCNHSGRRLSRCRCPNGAASLSRGGGVRGELAKLGDGGLEAVGVTEQRAAGDEHVGAGARRAGHGVGGDAAVDLDVRRRRRGRPPRPSRGPRRSSAPSSRCSAGRRSRGSRSSRARGRRGRARGATADDRRCRVERHAGARRPSSAMLPSVRCRCGHASAWTMSREQPASM